MDLTNSPNQPPPDVSAPVSSPSPPSDTPPPDLGSNIPVKTQSTPPSPPQPLKPVAADDDLDKIMQDVGHQLKKEDEKPSKKRRSFFGRKPKNQPEAKLQAQPLPPLPIIQSPPKPGSELSRPDAKAAGVEDARKSTTGKTSSAPVMVITLTIIVTSILIIAAVYAYKK